MIVFRCYDPASNKDGGIHAWYDSISSEAQAAIDTELEQLTLLKNLESLPHVHPIRGRTWAGLTAIEVDFVFDGTKYLFRLIGFDGPGAKEFTLLIGFEKLKGNHALYGPACRTAQKRKEGVLRDGRRAPPCQFP
jgi:hypothetical protein